jgi:hypothetical protein
MRDSVQPRQPSARILLLCRVVQDVAHARGGLQVLAASTSRLSQLIAGFAVSIKCRFCVSAEALFLNELPSIDDWQSYYVFFLAPHGKEFRFACETTGVDEAPDGEEDMSTETTYPGEGWIGCAAGVCLAAPYAVINLCSYSRYEDGTTSTPDVESFIYCDKTQDRIDPDQYHQELLSQASFQKLEGLRRALASILAKHGMQVLDRAVLNLRVTGLKASEEVFLEEPLRVQDAFFFRGA